MKQASKKSVTSLLGFKTHILIACLNLFSYFCPYISCILCYTSHIVFALTTYSIFDWLKVNTYYRFHFFEFFSSTTKFLLIFIQLGDSKNVITDCTVGWHCASELALFCVGLYLCYFFFAYDRKPLKKFCRIFFVVYPIVFFSFLFYLLTNNNAY